MKRANRLELTVKIALAAFVLSGPIQKAYASTQELIDSLKIRMHALPSIQSHFYNDPEESAKTYFFDLSDKATVIYQISNKTKGKEVLGVDLSETKYVPPGFSSYIITTTGCQPESVFYQYIPLSKSTRRHAESFFGVSPKWNMQYQEPTATDSTNFDNTVEAVLRKLSVKK